MDTADKDNAPAKELNVWIVEDHPSYRKSMVFLLNSMDGFNCEKDFEDVESALDELKEGKPDIILCDIDLPGMNGVAGVAAFKAVYDDIFVIMLTVHDEEEYIFNAICAGADGYLLKSTSEEELNRSIMEVVNGGAPINPRIAHKVLKMFSTFAPKQDDYDLTEREQEVLKLITNGKTKKHVAAELFLSFHTVDYHLRNIYKKLQVNSRTEAVAKALRERII
ncbi:MAG: response regulator transcription factor [Balneolia bacterium]|nr:response regulator transcription factor [Balneolia bacterium]